MQFDIEPGKQYVVECSAELVEELGALLDDLQKRHQVGPLEIIGAAAVLSAELPPKLRRVFLGLHNAIAKEIDALGDDPGLVN